MSDLARVLLDELAGDPVALARLRELVAPPSVTPEGSAPAYTPRTLALELGRSERSVRAAIARGELEAVKRGRGWVIGAHAVAAWAQAPLAGGGVPRQARARRAPAPGPGPMARALRENR